MQAKCSSKFNNENRKELFSGFWELGDIERQFISNSMQTIQPKYRYIRQGGIRSQEIIIMHFIYF